jgi:hypothetical protein
MMSATEKLREMLLYWVCIELNQVWADLVAVYFVTTRLIY